MIITRIHRLQDSVRFRLAEWGLAVVMFSWGWLLLLPYDSLSIPVMAGLLQAAPETVWGTGCLALGGARLCVLVVNGAWRRNAHARAICAFLSCFVWVQICIGLAATGIVTTGLATYPVLLLMDIYVVFRAAAEARDTDEAWRNGKP